MTLALHYWQPLGWKVEGTGGNCTALVARTPDYELFVVSTRHTATAPVADDEPCSLGVWNGETEDVTDYSTARAAVHAAERFLTRHARD